MCKKENKIKIYGGINQGTKFKKMIRTDNDADRATSGQNWAELCEKKARPSGKIRKYILGLYL